MDNYPWGEGYLSVTDVNRPDYADWTDYGAALLSSPVPGSGFRFPDFGVPDPRRTWACPPHTQAPGLFGLALAAMISLRLTPSQFNAHPWLFWLPPATPGFEPLVFRGLPNVCRSLASLRCCLSSCLFCGRTSFVTCAQFVRYRCIYIYIYIDSLSVAVLIRTKQS